MKHAETKRAVKRNVNRHKIRFPVARATASLDTAVTEVQVLIRAKNGWTTKAIANDLGLSKGEVTYRIAKGLAGGDRAKFRNGETWVAQRALSLTAHDLIIEIGKTISPKYA